MGKKGRKIRIYEKCFKRLFDIVFSFLALVILSPALLVVAILVRIKLGSPVIFKQERPGKNEKIFKLYKFRTMSDKRDKNGKLLPDEKRLTKFGKKLRSTSLDELPELFNILRGDMSFVGPRPMLVKDLVFFDKKTLERQSVTPGLTGLAQVKGRNSISWEDRFKYDLEYVRKISFVLDVKIIALTLLLVLRRDGIGENGGDLSMDYGDYLLKSKKIDKGYYEKKQIIADKIIRGVHYE